MSSNATQGKERGMSPNATRSRPAHLWKPGQSGNPAGRPKGSRNKLSEDLIGAISADFKAHGKAAIVKLRKTNPGKYLDIVCKLVPSELHIVDKPAEDMTDEQLAHRLQTLLKQQGMRDVTPSTPARAEQPKPATIIEHEARDTLEVVEWPDLELD